MSKLTQIATLGLVLSLFLAPAFGQEDQKSDKTEQKTTTKRKADKKKKGKKNTKGMEREQGRLSKQLSRRFKNANLTPEQEKKLANMVKENFAKIREIQQAISELMPKGSRKRLGEAMKKLKEEGVAKKEIRSKALTSIGVSEDDQAKMKELQAKRMKLMNGMTKTFQESLTEEQKEALKKGRKGQGKKGRKAGKGKKGKKKKADGDGDQG